MPSHQRPLAASGGAPRPRSLTIRRPCTSSPLPPTPQTLAPPLPTHHLHTQGTEAGGPLSLAVPPDRRVLDCFMADIAIPWPVSLARVPPLALHRRRRCSRPHLWRRRRGDCTASLVS